MKPIVLLLSVSFLLVYCKGQTETSEMEQSSETKNENVSEQQLNSEAKSLIDSTQKTIEKRFTTPNGFTRIEVEKNSFGAYLRNLPLKDIHSKVLYYNGAEKPNNHVYCSVIDMKISAKDLQQCADAVMRLRGEYLFHESKFEQIHFDFLSDGEPRYFKDFANGTYSYERFLEYLDWIFNYANTTSLSNELQSVNSIEDIQIGDVFVEKKQPFGHAVTVVDVAENNEGKKIFLLAQSYMPAQETQILINPTNSELSPWFEAKNATIQTPEWSFEPSHLKRFPKD